MPVSCVTRNFYQPKLSKMLAEIKCIKNKLKKKMMYESYTKNCSSIYQTFPKISSHLKAEVLKQPTVKFKIGSICLALVVNVERAF